MIPNNQKRNRQVIKQLKKKKPKDLDQQFLTHHEVVFQEMDCLTCANCCKTTSPIFLQTDISRIAKYLGIKAMDFQSEYLNLDDEDDFVLKKAPCPFLQSDNTCEIYEVRPKACREYPHTDRKRMDQILDLTLKNASICPAVDRILSRLDELQS